MNKPSRSVAGKTNWLRDLLLLLLLVSVLFGYGLGSRALWNPDEGRYAEIPREMAQTGDYVTPRLNGVKYFEKPVLFYWLQAGAIRLFGVHEWSLRLWTELFAAFGCLAVYVAGCRLYNRRAGWLAAGVLATSPLYGLLSGVITLDMTVSVLISMALLAFLIGVREPPGTTRRTWLWAFYALAACATLTKGLIGIVIPGMVIGAWIVLLGEWRLLRSLYLPSGLLLFFAIAAPWHVLAARANPEFLHFYFVHEHFERYLTTAHQRYQPLWFFVPVLLAGMFPWSVFLWHGLKDALRNAWRQRRVQREVWFLVLWAALVLAFFSISKSKLMPYILPVLPPLALLLGRYLAQVWERPVAFVRHRLFWLLLAVAGALGLALVLIPIYLAGHPKATVATELLGPHLYLMAASLMLAGVVPFVFSRLGDARRTITSLLAMSALLLVVFEVSLPRLDLNRSVKSLALELKPRLRLGDEVIAYHEYYQDLPVYLERRITVAGWKGELEFGTQVEDTSAWMIDDLAFAQRLRGGTVYIVTDQSNYETLRQDSALPLFLLARSGRNVLLSNREPTRQESVR